MPVAPDLLLPFLLASVLVTVVPGADMALVTRQVLVGGPRLAYRTIAGNLTGLLVHGTALAIGLSALLLASAAAYTTVKLVGAAYLVWLGVQAIRGVRRPAELKLVHRRSTATQTAGSGRRMRDVPASVRGPRGAVRTRRAPVTAPGHPCQEEQSRLGVQDRAEHALQVRPPRGGARETPRAISTAPLKGVAGAQHRAATSTRTGSTRSGVGASSSTSSSPTRRPRRSATCVRTSRRCSCTRTKGWLEYLRSYLSR
jgi:hypothetical protein